MSTSAPTGRLYSEVQFPKELAAQVLDFRRRRFACRIAQQPLLAGLKEFFAPAVIEIRRQAFAAAERRDALFPAESHSPHSIPPTPLLCFSIHVTSSPFSDVALQRAAVLQVGGDAGGAEGMVPDPGLDAIWIEAPAIAGMPPVAAPFPFTNLLADAPGPTTPSVLKRLPSKISATFNISITSTTST